MKGNEVKYSAALETAVKQLAYRPLSEKLLRRKLAEKGYDEDAIEQTVGWLEKRNLLNDFAYAEMLVRSYTGKGYGASRIQMELRKRGVGREDAAKAMSGYAPDFKRMTALLDKRLKGDLSDRKTVDKAVAALSRRGFNWPEIKEALEYYASQQ